MQLWSAFVIGLVGSLHCIGMCGPIAAALPLDQSRKVSVVFGRVVYNFGRIISYVFLGAILGILGRSIYLGGYQQLLSITLGVLILLSVILPAKYSQVAMRSIGIEKVFTLLRRSWAKLFRNSSKPALLGIGILNGFLPCGFVYVGLAGAVSTGGITSSAMYMALFGLGTLPIMLALSLAGNFISTTVRQSILRFVPALTVLIAILFIVRGLGLGIPYVSPKFSPRAQVSEMGSCCQEK